VQIQCAVNVFWLIWRKRSTHYIWETTVPSTSSFILKLPDINSQTTDQPPQQVLGGKIKNNSFPAGTNEYFGAPQNSYSNLAHVTLLSHWFQLCSLLCSETQLTSITCRSTWSNMTLQQCTYYSSTTHISSATCLCMSVSCTQL
jgi:hypothetical protein